MPELVDKPPNVASGRTVILLSQEEESFNVPEEVAKMSELVKSMIDEGAGEDEIPISQVKSSILVKVIEFCQHYIAHPMEEIEKPLKSLNMHELVDEWYANFISVEQQVLFDLILAANYMDIEPLSDLGCAAMASMIKGRTPEELRRQFNIVNDFTPEEEAQVMEENKWCEEA
eukprot:gene5250-5630_t